MKDSILMHEDIPVALVDGETLSFTNILNAKELPVGILQKNPKLTNLIFATWQKKRTIPQNRQFAHLLQKALGYSFTEAMVKNMAVSLTDTYWLKPQGSDLEWKDVNYHDNLFSNEVSRRFIQREEIDDTAFLHPNFTTDGILEKSWILLDNEPYLLKFDETKKQLLGEIFASKVADFLQIPHVSYDIVKIHGRTACICPCIVKDKHTDMVFARQYAWQKEASGISLFYELSKKDAHGLNQMLFLDALTRQMDRHEYNFAFLGDTLAPLYDNGRCLARIDYTGSKPFITDRFRQLDLIDEYFAVPPLNFLKECYLESCDVVELSPENEILESILDAYETMKQYMAQFCLYGQKEEQERC